MILHQSYAGIPEIEIKVPGIETDLVSPFQQLMNREKRN